jgi:hypothetical protein
MTHIPDQLVVRSVIDIVYSHSNLYSTERGGEVSGVFGALLNDILAHLLAIAWQLVDGQLS